MSNEALVLVMIIGALISLTIATSKNRNAFGWLVAGAMFPVISIIIIASLDAVKAPTNPAAT